VSSVDEAEIDLDEGVSMWEVPGLEVDSFVREVRTFDRHLPACGNVQAVLAYRWLMYGFQANFCVRVSHHYLHVMTLCVAVLLEIRRYYFPLLH
jgi:hypothetical protein